MVKKKKQIDSSDYPKNQQKTCTHKHTSAISVGNDDGDWRQVVG